MMLTQLVAATNQPSHERVPNPVPRTTPMSDASLNVNDIVASTTFSELVWRQPNPCLPFEIQATSSFLDPDRGLAQFLRTKDRRRKPPVINDRITDGRSER
ncbi:hypothetical protein [Rhizobium sp. Z1P35]